MYEDPKLCLAVGIEVGLELGNNVALNRQAKCSVTPVESEVNATA